MNHKNSIKKKEKRRRRGNSYVYSKEIKIKKIKEREYNLISYMRVIIIF